MSSAHRDWKQDRDERIVRMLLPLFRGYFICFAPEPSEQRLPPGVPSSAEARA